MKIFHLSDLHIGKKVYDFSMIPDQEYILNQILNLAEAEKPEAVILAGDIYDRTVPPAEAPPPAAPDADAGSEVSS